MNGNSASDTGEGSPPLPCDWCGKPLPAAGPRRTVMCECGRVNVVATVPVAPVAGSPAPSQPVPAQCPYCKEPVTESDSVCRHCSSSLRRPPPATPAEPWIPPRSKLIREITIFLIGVGLLSAGLGVTGFLLARTEFLQLISIALALCGGWQLACGILLPIRRTNGIAYLGAAPAIAFFMAQFLLSVAFSSGQVNFCALAIPAAIALFIANRVSYLRKAK